MDDAIHRHLPNLKSPESIIDSGGVWKGSERLYSKSALLKCGDSIKIYESPTQGYVYHFSRESIIQETEDWVIVMKEPLITIGMDRSNMFFNLMAGLNNYYGHTNMAQGVQPITRLDYRVSGLSLFSKHKKAERRLFMQMQQGRIKKRYFAIVSDTEPIHQRCQIKNRLLFKSKAIQSNDGKLSKTRFILHRSNTDGVHVYHAITKTGRRHQVRAHAKQSIGALVNDDLYGAIHNNRHATIGLIASHIQFYWNGKWIKISMPRKWETQALQWLKMGAG